MSRVLCGLKTRYNRFVIGVSGYFPVGVTARRNEDTRRAAASGNCRSGDIAVRTRVVIRHLVEGLIGRFD